jgi:hypothetical protein
MMHQISKECPALPAPQPRSRRDRRARRELPIVRHLVMPGLEVARAEARPRETVTAFLRRTGWATRDRKYGWQFRKGLPTILEINGEAVLLRDWRRRRISVRADVRFVSYPLGGNGGTKQILAWFHSLPSRPSRSGPVRSLPGPLAPARSALPARRSPAASRRASSASAVRCWSMR